MPQSPVRQPTLFTSVVNALANARIRPGRFLSAAVIAGTTALTDRVW